MNDLIEKYRKPTPPGWRNVGDFALVMIPVIMGAAPNLPISASAQTWIMQIGAVLMVGIKFWTNTKVNPNVYEGNCNNGR